MPPLHADQASGGFDEYRGLRPFTKWMLQIDRLEREASETKQLDEMYRLMPSCELEMGVFTVAMAAISI